MAFFDDSFMKNNNPEDAINDLQNNNPNPNKNPKNIPNNMPNNSRITTDSNFGPELEVNRSNREEYEDLMRKSQSSSDMYFDKNNIIIKIILFILFIAIVAGVIYYIQLFISKM